MRDRRQGKEPGREERSTGRGENPGHLPAPFLFLLTIHSLAADSTDILWTQSWLIHYSTSRNTAVNTDKKAPALLECYILGKIYKFCMYFSSGAHFTILPSLPYKQWISERQNGEHGDPNRRSLQSYKAKDNEEVTVGMERNGWLRYPLGVTSKKSHDGRCEGMNHLQTVSKRFLGF